MSYSGYNRYRGRTHGRMLHCIHTYIPELWVRENCAIGADSITLNDDVVATFDWPDDMSDDKPIISFFSYPDKYSKRDLSKQWEKNQFFRRPYLDSVILSIGIEYPVQEVRKCLSLDDAIIIKCIRDEHDGDWDYFHGIDALKEKISLQTKVASYDCLNEDADWKHVAMCAIYDI